MSNEKKNWWQIAGNLIAIPAGVITLVQFFIDQGMDVRILAPELPVYTTALYAGLGALIICLLVASNLKWWKGYRSMKAQEQADEIYQIRQKKEAEKENAVQTSVRMRELLGGHDFFTDPNVAKSTIEIGKRGFRQAGLAPPRGATDQDWVKHLARLEPFIRAFGIEGARQEMKSWYGSN